MNIRASLKNSMLLSRQQGPDSSIGYESDQLRMPLVPVSVERGFGGSGKLCVFRRKPATNLSRTCKAPRDAARLIGEPLLCSG